MYNFEIVNPKNKKELYNLVSDHDIFRYYFGEFEQGEWYNSPFPFRKDDDPSLRIDYYNDEWVFRDFGIDKRPKDAITFVMWLESLNFDQALIKIYNDLTSWDKKSAKRVIGKKLDIVDAGIRLTKWRKFEYDYWNQAEITQEDLKRYKTYCCELWINGKRISYSTQNQPQFVYVFSKSKKIWKTYRPNAVNKKKKFYGHNITDHIQGWNLLPKSGEIVFITKSYKDVMVFNKAGYAACAPHAESTFLTPWEIDILKSRFEHIYVNYDNDDTGVKRSIEFTQEHDLKYWNVPLGLSTLNKVVKDPFDLVTNYSYKLFEECLTDKFAQDGV